MAITAMVLSIVGCCSFFIPLNIAGAIIGGIAMSKAKKEPEEYAGYGMAVTGLVLGIIGAIVGLLVIIFYAAIIMAALSGDVPPECLEDPDSAACDQALEEQNNGSAATAGGLSLSILPAVAVPRWVRPGPYAG